MRKPVVNIAVQAARAAGKLILRSLSKRDSIKIEEKSRLDFTTEVDRQSEAEIIKELRRAYPDHAILGEESGLYEPKPGQSARYRWVIDPLDGTSNFTRGFPHFSISIGLLDQGVPIAGVVYNPLSEELFTAYKGAGAYLNDKRIRVGQRVGLAGALIGTGFSPRQRARLSAQFRMLSRMLEDAEDLRRTGSAALDLCFVACGRMDGFFELGLKPWDISAGIVIVREAGGTCIDFNGAENFLDSGNLVAGNLKVSAQLVARIQASMKTVAEAKSSAAD
jgi:myo-inositol-1(or 4)-monophosphatase